MQIFQKPHIGSGDDAWSEEEPSLCKGEIRLHFSLHWSTEWTLFHATVSSEHMAD